MGVKYRLSYCNKYATPLRLDIEDDSYSGAILPIKAGSNPFSLRMNNDEEFLKLGTIRTTEASMEILSSSTFNIDVLADNSETKLNVKFYFNNVLEWTGFILPDFYQETISDQKIINITATDRLGILKDIPFPENYQNISLLDIVKKCLLETGLSLNIVTLIGYNAVGKSLDNRPLEVQVVGERLFNQNGDVLNCYDVLMSVLDTFNCFITQFRGKWHIINKQQLESGLGRVIEYNYTVGNNTIVSNTEFSRGVYELDKVYSGGERILRPVLSDVGILGEFGGSVLYPKNNNFRQWSGSAFADWTAHNGFIVGNYVNNPISYNSATGKINSYMAGSTNKLDNNNTLPAIFSAPVDMNTQRYLQSAPIPLVLDNVKDSKVNIDYSINITTRNKSLALFALILETPSTSKKYYLLNGSTGAFEYAGNNISNLDFRTLLAFPLIYVIDTGVARLIASNISIDGDDDLTKVIQTTLSGSASIGLDIAEDFSNCKLYVRIFNVGDFHNLSSASTIQSLISYVKVDVKSSSSLPKGNLYRATRSGNFTAKTDIKTSVFSDYLTRGLNGYFYSYPSDDSSVIQANGLWTTNYDSNQLPVLQHTVRQISRLYANVHSDYLVTIHEPRLSILDLMSIVCKSQSFVVTNYTIDYLRSQINLTASQKTSATNPDSEFIYSYFGDEGGTNVSGLSSIGSGGSGGGGGSQNLQQTLDRGNEGDKMIITDLMVIPTQAPDVEDMQDGAIWLSDDGVSAGDVSGSLNSLSDVEIDSPTNNQVLTYNSTTNKWENKSGGGGGGANWGSIGGTLSNQTDLQSALNSKANTVHTHAASDIVSGVFNTARLGTGTANSTKVLYGDGTWKDAPSGGGGTVTSVSFGSYVAGLYVTGGPITTSGTIYLNLAANYFIPNTTLWAEKQDKLTAGSGISIVGNTISATSSGGTWGSITGTLSNQTDLQNALNGKQATLVSGTNIKNVNGNSLLGSGNVSVGTVTSVGVSVPTGLSVSNTPITSSGTIAITLASGYSIPTATKQGQWDSAYSWGNHAIAGYATQTWVNSQGFLKTFTEADPTVPSHVKSITATNISNWDSAYTHVSATDNPHNTTLQQVLNSGRVGDSMQITESLRIPTAAPSSPSNGDIWISDDGVNAGDVSGSIGSLTDVEITTPSNNQGLIYNGSTNKWENKTANEFRSVVSITGTTTTVDSSRANVHIIATQSAGIAATVVTAPALTVVRFRQNSVGKITFTGSGVTILAPPGKQARTSGLNAMVTLFYETSTTVVITGDLDNI